MDKSLSLNVPNYKVDSKEDALCGPFQLTHDSATKASLYQTPVLPFSHASRKGDLALHLNGFLLPLPLVNPIAPLTFFSLCCRRKNGNEKSGRREQQRTGVHARRNIQYSLTQEMWDQGRDCQTRVVYYFISLFFKLCISAEMVISFCLHYSYCHSLSDYTEPRQKEPLFIHLHIPIPCHRAGPHSHTVNTFVEEVNEEMNEWQRYSITRERYIVFVFFFN